MQLYGKPSILWWYSWQAETFCQGRCEGRGVGSRISPRLVRQHKISGRCNIAIRVSGCQLGGSMCWVVPCGAWECFAVERPRSAFQTHAWHLKSCKFLSKNGWNTDLTKYRNNCHRDHQDLFSINICGCTQRVIDSRPQMQLPNHPTTACSTPDL